MKGRMWLTSVQCELFGLDYEVDVKAPQERNFSNCKF